MSRPVEELLRDVGARVAAGEPGGAGFPVHDEFGEPIDPRCVPRRDFGDLMGRIAMDERRAKARARSSLKALVLLDACVVAAAVAWWFW